MPPGSSVGRRQKNIPGPSKVLWEKHKAKTEQKDSNWPKGVTTVE